MKKRNDNISISEIREDNLKKINQTQDTVFNEIVKIRSNYRKSINLGIRKNFIKVSLVKNKNHSLVEEETDSLSDN